MTEPIEISVRESSGTAPKQPPSAKAIPVPYEYSASSDSMNENLLVLLHGLGNSRRIIALSHLI